MKAFHSLLCVLALALLVVTVHSAKNDLNKLYNSRIAHAERVKRPLGKLPFRMGPISHSGVRVTLENGKQYLIHKGNGYGRSSQTVVTDAAHMSSRWEPVSSKNFGGRKTVGDLVKAGGTKYNVLTNNCHLASRRMMKQ